MRKQITARISRTVSMPSEYGRKFSALGIVPRDCWARILSDLGGGSPDRVGLSSAEFLGPNEARAGLAGRGPLAVGRMVDLAGGL